MTINPAQKNLPRKSAVVIATNGRGVSVFPGYHLRIRYFARSIVSLAKRIGTGCPDIILDPKSFESTSVIAVTLVISSCLLRLDNLGFIFNLHSDKSIVLFSRANTISVLLGLSLEVSLPMLLFSWSKSLLDDVRYLSSIYRSPSITDLLTLHSSSAPSLLSSSSSEMLYPIFSISKSV